MELPNFDYEKRLWDKGIVRVAGADEVGRGCFAGPVVAGCVCFDSALPIHSISSKVKIDDSKRLTTLQREKADVWIRSNSLGWGVGVATVTEINKLGIVHATHSAFRRAVGNMQRTLHPRVEYLLIDAFYIPYIRDLRMPRKIAKIANIKTKSPADLKFSAGQLAIGKGDAKSMSIAAASIVAKVYRDKLMMRLGATKPFTKYNWTKNKGYGTRQHREALLAHGPTKHHRKQFIQKYI